MTELADAVVPGVSKARGEHDTARRKGHVRRRVAVSSETGGMRILQYVVGALLAVGLVVTSIGWYLSAHPGGTRFESCHWEGDELVLGYTYNVGDTVTTRVAPKDDDVVAQFRIDEASGTHSQQVLQGEARFRVGGGPRPVHYPNGAELNCPTRS